MNEKGLTLIEIIGVIVILGLIALITIPAISRTLKDSKSKLYNLQVESIKESARSFTSDFLKVLPSNEGDSFTIELKLLKDRGLVKEKLKNPKTEDYFADYSLITLTYNNGLYDAEFYPIDSTVISNTVKYYDYLVMFKGNATSESSSSNPKENVFVITKEGTRVSEDMYTVSIIGVDETENNHANIDYQVVVDDEGTDYTYVIRREENCSSGLCN